jgi:hypothetical protein
MKISFPNCGSGAGISIRAAINALLNWHKAERNTDCGKEEKRAANHFAVGLSAQKTESITRGLP